ncbi:MAG: hypothetical protein QOI95_1843 [Acidimicrobiaceae bacterium]|jgi:hypothetical protein
MTDATPRDPDSLPDSSDPSGPCPRCGRVASFTLKGAAPVTYVKDGSYSIGQSGAPERNEDERVAILECSGCRDCIVVIEAQFIGGVPRAEGMRRGGTMEWRGFHWWPIPGGSMLDPAVPALVADAFTEGMRCLAANAPNGAVSMFRVVLTYVVLDKGSAEAKAKPDLKDKITQMVADAGLPPALGDWATHVRLYGNAGAHPDLFGPVTVDEAHDVALLIQSLLDVLYVVPANIAKRQAERRP